MNKNGEYRTSIDSLAKALCLTVKNHKISHMVKYF